MSGYNPDIHVPGVWRCAKCAFRLQQMNLNSQDGSVTPRDDTGDKCPNDGSPLWRVTWRQEFTELSAMVEPLFERQAIVDRICSEEGATVSFSGDNPDFNDLPNSAISVAASFTSWDERLFRADTVLDALRLAEAAKQAFEGGSL